MEMIAATLVDGIESHLVLIVDDVDRENSCVDLFVSHEHYSQNRTVVESKGFSSLEEALTFCTAKYGVTAAAWKKDPAFEFRFDFQFRVTNSGIPQPFPLGFGETEVVFQLGEKENLLDGSKTPSLLITGNRAGLRELAARLLLCADSEQYDPDFHMHLDAAKTHRLSNVDVTLYSPTRLAQA
jgi:hypothetical protein